MAYNMKYTITVNAASSASFGQAQSTRTFHGILDTVVYRPSSSPLTAGCSGFFLLRRGSTVGDILTRSSSACAAQKSYSPRRAVIASSGLATSGLSGPVYLAGDKVYCIRNAGSSDGFALGGKLDLIIRGDHGY